MQMFNVQSKTDTNQTKRLMEKTYKKTIKQSAVQKGSPMVGVRFMIGRISGKGFQENSKPTEAVRLCN